MNNLLSITYIQGITIILILLFNSGIVMRIIQTIVIGMLDEEFPVKKRLINCLKAIVITNTISGVILIIESYYK